MRTPKTAIQTLQETVAAHEKQIKTLLQAVKRLESVVSKTAKNAARGKENARQNTAQIAKLQHMLKHKG